MYSKKVYRYSVKNFTVNGEACQDLDVQFDEPLCADIVCEYDKSTREIVVTIPDDCTDNCIYGVVRCLDPEGDCDHCPNFERIKICPCDTAADCQDCEKCVDNMCVSKCTDGQVCVEDRCTDCESNDDCPCNQVCTTDGCACPSNLPHENDKGCCNTCQSDSDCGPCYYCTPDGCKPKDCGTGVCDPATGECKQCVNSGDCGPNEVCKDGRCVCQPGFERDSNGNCVPRPDCIRDEDCGECSICNGTRCEPLVCPIGYVCVGDDCKKECDCNNPSCPGNQNCVRKDSETCYCEPCLENCNDPGGCPDGCICDKADNDCVPNPCYAPCATGADCGEGCGCNKAKGICEPCNDKDCGDECEDIDGCQCTNGVSCEKNLCSGPCAGPSDCGPGCGCYRGSCVKCSEIPCDDCLDAIGCECLDGVTCEESPCSDTCVDANDCGSGCGCTDNNNCISCKAVDCKSNNDCPNGCACGQDNKCAEDPCYKPCSSDNDCGENCNCDEGFCRSCTGADCRPKTDGCNDEITLEAVTEGCDLRMTQTLTDCCACPDITLGVDVLNAVTTTGVLSFEVAAYLKKGTANSWNGFIGSNLDFLSETGIQNELPEEGTIRITAKAFYAGGRVNTLTENLNVEGKDGKGRTLSAAFSNIATEDKDENPLVRLTLSYSIVNPISFPNQCVYTRAPQIIFSDDYDLLNTNDNIVSILTKESPCRNPLYTFYKSETDLFPDGDESNQFLKKYAEGGFSGGPVILTLDDYNKDGIEYGKYHAVKSDCGCDRLARYSCFGDENRPTKLVFRHPREFEVTFDNCSQEIIFPQGVEFFCDTMQQSPIRPEFEVLVNRTVVDVVKPAQGSNVIYARNHRIRPNEPVRSVTIRQKLDPCNITSVTRVNTADTPEIDLTIEETPCSGDPGDLVIGYTAQNLSGPFNFVLKRGTTTVAQGTLDMTSGVLPAVSNVDGVYELTLTDQQTGCIITGDISYRASDFSVGELVEISFTCDDSKSIPGLAEIINNSQYDAQVEITAIGNSSPLHTALIKSSGLGTYELDNGVYQAEVTLIDSNGSATSCVKSETLDITCCSQDFDVSVNCAETKVVVENNTRVNVTYVVKNQGSGAVIEQGSLGRDEVAAVQAEENKTYTVEIQEPGCDLFVKSNIKFTDCCPNFSDSVSVEPNCDGGVVSVDVDPGGNNVTFSMTNVSDPTDTYQLLSVTNPTTLSLAGTGGTYSYIFTDQATGCTKTGTVEVSCCDQGSPDINVEVVCGSSSSDSFLRITAPGAAHSVGYEVRKVTGPGSTSLVKTGQFPASGSASVQAELDSTYEVFAKYVGSGINCPLEKKQTVQVTSFDCCESILSSLSATNDLCDLDQIVVNNPNGLNLRVTLSPPIGNRQVKTGPTSQIVFSGLTATGNYEVEVEVLNIQGVSVGCTETWNFNEDNCGDDVDTESGNICTTGCVPFHIDSVGDCCSQRATSDCEIYAVVHLKNGGGTLSTSSKKIRGTGSKSSFYSEVDNWVSQEFVPFLDQQLGVSTVFEEGVSCSEGSYRFEIPEPTNGSEPVEKIEFFHGRGRQSCPDIDVTAHCGGGVDVEGDASSDTECTVQCIRIGAPFLSQCLRDKEYRRTFYVQTAGGGGDFAVARYRPTTDVQEFNSTWDTFWHRVRDKIEEVTGGTARLLPTSPCEDNIHFASIEVTGITKSQISGMHHTVDALEGEMCIDSEVGCGEVGGFDDYPEPNNCEMSCLPICKEREPIVPQRARVEVEARMYFTDSPDFKRWNSGFSNNYDNSTSLCEYKRDRLTSQDFINWIEKETGSTEVSVSLCTDGVRISIPNSYRPVSYIEFTSVVISTEQGILESEEYTDTVYCSGRTETTYEEPPEVQPGEDNVCSQNGEGLVVEKDAVQLIFELTLRYPNGSDQVIEKVYNPSSEADACDIYLDVWPQWLKDNGHVEEVTRTNLPCSSLGTVVYQFTNPNGGSDVLSLRTYGVKSDESSFDDSATYSCTSGSSS